MAPHPLICVVHSCAREEADAAILQELLAALHTSHLSDVLTMTYVGHVGAMLPRSVESFLPQHAHVRQLGDAAQYEIPTLQWVHAIAQSADPRGAVLYLMTKGVNRHGPPECAAAWRRYMTYFLVERWQQALVKLFEGGAQAVGCDLLDPGDAHAHFSGNFWWAKTSYLAKRPVPDGGLDPHHASEQWLLDVDTPVSELHHSANNHYRQPYERERYVIDENRERGDADV